MNRTPSFSRWRFGVKSGAIVEAAGGEGTAKSRQIAERRIS
jgi:hypothetical protein